MEMKIQQISQQNFNTLNRMQRPKSFDELNESQQMEVNRLQRLDEQTKAEASVTIDTTIKAEDKPKLNFQTGPDGKNYAVGLKNDRTVIESQKIENKVGTPASEMQTPRDPNKAATEEGISDPNPVRNAPAAVQGYFSAFYSQKQQINKYM